MERGARHQPDRHLPPGPGGGGDAARDGRRCRHGRLTPRAAVGAGPAAHRRTQAPGGGAHGGARCRAAATRARQSEPDTESYAASKGGLVALTHALAVSLGPDVRVNCISPGWIDTKGEALRPDDHAQHPVGRVGRPEDVAALVAWLLGPESGFVTGAEFVLDGGMTRRMIYAE